MSTSLMGKLRQKIVVDRVIVVSQTEKEQDHSFKLEGLTYTLVSQRKEERRDGGESRVRG